MKKFYQQIIPIFIIVAILPMIGTFCYPLIDSVASMPEMITMESTHSDLDACQLEIVAKTTSGPFLSEAPLTNHHNNSLLPCCQDGGRANTANLSSLSSLDHTVMAILFVNPDLNSLNTGSIIYQAPDISPPELIALRTTVLRL